MTKSNSMVTLEEEERELAALARALSHPTRLRILRILDERQSCVCGDIVEALPIAQSTVSQHLKVLRDVGLVSSEVDGPRMIYSIEPRRIERFRVLVSAL